MKPEPNDSLSTQRATPAKIYEQDGLIMVDCRGEKEPSTQKVVGDKNKLTAVRDAVNAYFGIEESARDAENTLLWIDKILKEKEAGSASFSQDCLEDGIYTDSTGLPTRVCADNKSKVKEVVDQMRSAVTLSAQLGTPVADRQLITDWANELEGKKLAVSEGIPEKP